MMMADMEQESDTKDIKEEPFEEFLFPETVLQQTTTNLIESCCLLCAEGKKILKDLNEHFQTRHPGEALDICRLRSRQKSNE